MEMVPCKSLLICRKTEAVKYGRTAGSFRASVHSVAACKCMQHTLCTTESSLQSSLPKVCFKASVGSVAACRGSTKLISIVPDKAVQNFSHAAI